MQERINSKVQVTFENLKRATQDELSQVLQEALKTAVHNITLGSLRKDHARDGTMYRHPETDEALIRMHHGKAPSKAIRGYREVSVYAEDSYEVLSPQGHIASRIKASIVTTPGISEGIPVVSEIRDYYPPSKKTKQMQRLGVSKGELKYEHREHHRGITRDRHQARLRKNEYGVGIPGEPILNGAVNGHISAAVETDEASEPKIVGLQGKLRRERAFDVPDLNTPWIDRVKEAHEFKLQRRMAKDIIRHRNGSYTAVQYSGDDGYNVVHYNSSGKRERQTTYNSYGEATKHAGEQPNAPTLKKPNRPKPTDSQAARQAVNRILRREDHRLAGVRSTEDAWEVDTSPVTPNGRSR